MTLATLNDSLTLTGSVTFGSIAKTSVGDRDGYIASFNVDTGAFNWVVTYGSDDNGSTGNLRNEALAVSYGGGRVYATVHPHP